MGASKTAPSRRRRLLAFVPNPAASQQPGGVLTATRLLLGAPFTERFDVRIIDTSMRPFPVPNWRERIAASGARLAESLTAIDQWRPDVALAFCGERTSFYEKSLLLLAAKNAGARVFLSPRSGYVVDWLDKSEFGRTWVRATGHLVDGLLVQSSSWRDFFAGHGVPPEKMHVWYNSVDVEAWEHIAAARAAADGARPFRFLFLGWLTAGKGIFELIDACDRLDRNPGPGFALAIAGNGAAGPLIEHARATGTLSRQISLLGWARGGEVQEQLARADCLVLPSHGEGFPNVVAEAMACGLPVIATPVGAVPEIVRHEHSGLLVPVRAPQALAEAMDRLRRDPKLAYRMGQRGFENVKAKFGRSGAVARLISILSDEAASEPTTTAWTQGSECRAGQEEGRSSGARSPSRSG